jgi:hypothetical protein
MTETPHPAQPAPTERLDAITPGGAVTVWSNGATVWAS